MPYAQRINAIRPLASSDGRQLILEFNSLRAELNDMRAKYTALVALLAASTALGAGYNTGTALSARQFT